MTVPSTLRIQTIQRALGRCEYCHLPDGLGFAPHEIDHIVAQKHGGLTTLDNLALACILCNKHKGSDLTSLDPLSNEIVRLFHPRNDRWSDHFEVRDGFIVPLTSIGRVTTFLLQLNRLARIEERKLLISAKGY